MYKYKQTTDVEIGDLVVWTDIPINNYLTKNKVYQVINLALDNNPCVRNNEGKVEWYGKLGGFKVLQTKPASEAVVGDYMYRITSGPDVFPQHSVIKITKLDGKYLYYDTILSVRHDEVIVIAQAETEVKYPYFTESKQKGREYICKILEKEKYIYIHNWVRDEYNKIWNSQPPTGEPCDFTTEPEIFDIDWRQSRFEAGLPVYATDSTSTFLCKGIEPKQWYNGVTFSMTDPSLIQKVPMSKEDIELFKQQVPLSTLHLGLCQEISLGATADCSLQSTIKEQPMKLQQLLDTIFGVSDYEAKPKFIVTVFNNDKEVGTTTAESIEEIQQTIQSDTRLWGCKLVAHKIHSELQTQVPVAITKFKKETNASGE